MEASLGDVITRIIKYYNYILKQSDYEIVRICFTYYLKEMEKGDGGLKCNKVNKVFSLLRE